MKDYKKVLENKQKISLPRHLAMILDIAIANYKPKWFLS